MARSSWPVPARLTPMRHGSVAVAALLVVAILVNVGQFRSIDRNTIDNFAAVHRSDTADIIALSYRECDWCRDRFALHLALGEVAPGSTVLIPVPSRYASRRYTAEEFALRLYTFGAAARVHRVRTDATALLVDRASLTPVGYAVAAARGDDPGFDPTPYVVASGPGGAKGAPWALAVDPSPPGPDREFAVLDWPTAETESGYDHLDLMVETSLLPGAVRAELAR